MDHIQEDEVSLSYILIRARLAQSGQIPEASWGDFVILDPVRDDRVVSWIAKDYKSAKNLAEEENVTLIPAKLLTPKKEYEYSYAACIKQSRTSLD